MCDLIGRLFLGKDCKECVDWSVINKYIFDISIPFCHHLYLSATLKQYFTEFALA
jgi:hypothetical protein